LTREHQEAGDLRTNIRFLFYEGEQRRFWPKEYRDEEGRLKPRQPDQDVSEALMVLRHLGIVPWEFIVDETRELTTYRYADSVADYVMDSIDRSRIDLWDGKPPPLILTESRSLKGVLEATIAFPYLCDSASTNGQVGGFLYTDVIPKLKEDPTRLVAYLGDLDLQGGQIEDNTRSVLEEEVGQKLNWTRVMLTQEQATEHDLRRLAIQKVDRRYRPPRAYEAIETEALGQRLVQDILRRWLDGLRVDRGLDPLNDVLVRQAAQQEQVREALAQLASADDQEEEEEE
jgi:hypothetical protein